MIKILKSNEEWSKILSLEILNSYSFKLNLKNGDERYFNILEAIEEPSKYNFNEYEKNRLKRMYDSGNFENLDIDCGIISWGGWIEILSEELYYHTIKWRNEYANL